MLTVTISGIKSDKIKEVAGYIERHEGNIKTSDLFRDTVQFTTLVSAGDTIANILQTNLMCLGDNLSIKVTESHE